MSQLLAYPVPFVLRSFSKPSQKDNTRRPLRRSETGEKEIPLLSATHWPEAKITTSQDSRWGKVRFKKLLDLWAKNAPEEHRLDYQKVAKKIDKCVNHKFPLLNIAHANIFRLPPIPDHVKHVNLENLSSLHNVEKIDLPEQLRSLEIWDCPELRLLELPPQLQFLQIARSSKLSQILSWPREMTKVVICDTPYRNIPERIRQFPGTLIL